jgi:hypothetical protein
MSVDAPSGRPSIIHVLRFRHRSIGIPETSRELSLIELQATRSSRVGLSREWLVPNQIRFILMDQETDRTLKYLFFKAAIACNVHTFRVITLSEIVINLPDSVFA